METFLPLLLLLAAARLCGQAAAKVGQAPLVGEIFAGMILAVTLAHMVPEASVLGRLADNKSVELVAEFGVFFLVLRAGIEMQPREIARGSGVSLAVATGGMLLPLVAGAALGWAFLPESELKFAQALAIGVALSISAVPVAVEILGEFGLLHHRVGRTIVTAAIVDDVLALVLLAVLTAMIQTGALPDLAELLLLLVKVAVFFAVTVAASLLFYRFAGPTSALAHSAVHAFTVLIVGGLLFAVLAEASGLHFILGAFMAGLFFERSRVDRRVYRQIKATVDLISHGFLGPIFFASIGLVLDLAAVTAIPVFLALLIAAAFLGKLFGAGLPALMGGMGRRESLAVGIGMNGRGVIALVVISIASRAGLFAPAGVAEPLLDNLFSALIITAIITTIASPILLRKVVAGHRLRSPEQ